MSGGTGVDVAPVILRWFQTTATQNDVLVSGPSGLGYTYPAAWPAGKFDTFATISGPMALELMCASCSV